MSTVPCRIGVAHQVVDHEVGPQAGEAPYAVAFLR